MFRISRTLRSNLGSQNLNMCRKMQRHYQVLGIDPSQIATLTEQQIREAYLKAIQTSHPDVGGSTAAFLQVRESYRLVSNNYRQMSNPTAQHFPATLTEEEQREEQERWARAKQDAIRAMHRWILWKLLVWLTGIGFMLYVIYVCRASLNQNSNRAAQTYSEKPVRFTLTKEQAYDADAMFPEYSEWKARRNEEVERQMEGLRQLRSKYKDQNTTYAVRWRGQPYSADAMMLEGVRRNLRDSKLKGESEIHEDTADLTEELDEDVVT